MPLWSACAPPRSASLRLCHRASWRRRELCAQRRELLGLDCVEFVKLVTGHDAMMRHEVTDAGQTVAADMRHFGHGCRNRSPEARRKHRRRREPPDRLRRVRCAAGPNHLLAARHPRRAQADPHRGKGLCGRGGHPADRHRPAGNRILDAAPVPERPRVRRRPAHHRRHAGHRQDGRGRSLRRRSLHAGVCRGDARTRHGGRRRRRGRTHDRRRRQYRRRLDGKPRNARRATP